MRPRIPTFRAGDEIDTQIPPIESELDIDV
jgi:hypothetical protein